MRFIPSDELEQDTIVGRDIIFTAQKTAILKRGTVLNKRYIEYLQEKGYLGAYVNDEISSDIEIDETVDQKIFNDGVLAVMGDSVNDMLTVSNNIVDDILSKKNICTDLIDLRSYDDYTYHHCVNVAVYSVLVAKQMGLSEVDLQNICQAGLLHDLGKRQIPDEILNKPDRLTDEEFTIMKSHPKYSFDMVSKESGVNSVVKQAVLSHHENENGSGYPQGKEGDEISILAKIVHACDVYDALTTKRPYKDPYEPAKAFDYMKEGKGTLFNDRVVDALITVIPPYPAGIDVFLSNGERALCVNHEENKMRPIVRIVATGKDVNLNTDPEYKNVTIIQSGILPIGELDGQIHGLNEDRSAVKLVKKNVFVCDSSKINRMQIDSIIGSDARLRMFEQTLDVLNYVKEHGAPDLLIMEVDMVVMDGIKAVQRIREVTGTNVPVIFITAKNDSLSIMRARELGNSDYILKPANPVYIKERIYKSLYNLGT